ncbi:zinc ribbon domain-containing protein [Synechocystis sp. LEGE 06083]|uniref:double zinc ribbon domain-containing protein n=1 Tax=Synechocystis sp. LEGE 06083 TaxID=915336 RepID=UPI001881B7E8|nr:zinc ribbon domain-containing protein [Synechocystis sp. LEGE 06083]MBE9193782.1 zinc ribbon domain-containing protein [Synechocystis sp. LEGE 06083]
MSTLDARQLPKNQESLADYVTRQRETLGLSRQMVAQKAEIHLQSLGKIERGQTCSLNRRTLSGLAIALQVPMDYLESVARGQTETLGPSLKFCPHCWQPGTAPDPIWTDARAEFCFLCGTALQKCCAGCGEKLVSLTFRFCPFCGQSYQATSQAPSVSAVPE